MARQELAITAHKDEHSNNIYICMAYDISLPKVNKMNLSPHFALSEFIVSNTATKRGIDNTPSQEVINNLTTLSNTLEQVRSLLGFPMHIDSGYRCKELNEAVGGVPESAHLTGYAADFTCPQFSSPSVIVETLSKSEIKFDQVITEGTWVHNETTSAYSSL